MRRSVRRIVGSLASTTRIGRRRSGRPLVPIRCRRSTRPIECSTIRPAERSTTLASDGVGVGVGVDTTAGVVGTGIRVRRPDVPEPSRAGTNPVAQPVVRRHRRGDRRRRPGAVHRTRRAAGPDGILGVDSCVAIETNGFAREVLCTRDAEVDLVVAALVPFDATCPGGTEPHQDRQGMGIACITRP